MQRQQKRVTLCVSSAERLRAILSHFESITDRSVRGSASYAMLRMDPNRSTSISRFLWDQFKTLSRHTVDLVFGGPPYEGPCTQEVVDLVTVCGPRHVSHIRAKLQLISQAWPSSAP